MGRLVEARLIELEKLAEKESWPGDDDMLWLVEMVRKYRGKAIEAIARGIPADLVDWETDLTEGGRLRYLAKAQAILEADE